MTRQKSLFVAALLSCVSCTTTRPVGPATSVNKDAPKVCAEHCDSMGMRLSAVVIISNREGCVCEPQNARASVSATAALIAPILADEEEAHRQHQQHRQQDPGRPPPPYMPPYVPPPPPPTPR